MADGTGIEWTEATWNPITGCTKVSPGCAHCYIERSIPFRMEGRKFVNGTTGVRLHPERLEQPLRWKRPRMIFVNSLSDLFHEEVTPEFVCEVFRVMRQARQHTFQVLTKRPERMREVLSMSPLADALPLPNVWLGVSIENSRYTYRADVLRQIPAAVHFISAEPLLGSLVAEGHGAAGEPRTRFVSNNRHETPLRAPLDLTHIEWLIAGGESGSGYRPVNIAHVRELRDACATAGTAFFFKQWGGVRAKSGGKELDGVEHCAMPVAA